MKRKHFSPYFEVHHGMDGSGVFTTAEIKKGRSIHPLRGKIINHPTRTSIQIGKHQHVEDAMGGLINHSCHPNVKISKRKHAMVSTRNIHKGEEITFNYDKNEDVLAHPFRCKDCGKKICGRKKKF